MIKHIHAAIVRRVKSRKCAARAERAKLSFMVVLASILSSVAIRLHTYSTRVLRRTNRVREACDEPILYRCDQCAKVGIWTKKWRWYGPGDRVSGRGSQALTTIVCDECDSRHEKLHHQEPAYRKFSQNTETGS